ncbi:DUF3413 domain-containing protein [Conservatibacter flavescens]|uniref:DUF3413 domain-containing protein n=1 Tax=Conservatibacter flavescens TaxID=28161 RepID=A0A2M8S1Q5_9PAST|nr:DUF3413 domain-containing protein [Conservatibacter flavescens]PJG85048.1 hypothetical protein CVP05_07255 [Conservatibacter flavescens]
MIKLSRQYREETSQKISWGHWFAFFNIIWAIAIGSRYAFLIDWPDTLLGKIYFFISILGHFSFAVFACYLLIVFPLSFIIKNHRTFRGVSVILATIGQTLLLVDTEVFARFNLHLSSVVWNLLVNPENGELSRNWQIFFAPMPIVLLAQMLFSRWSWDKLRSLSRQRWRKWVAPFFIGCFIATHLIYSWADAFIYRPITMQKSNFPLSYPMTARTFLEKHGFLDKTEYDETIQKEGRLDAPKVDYPLNALKFGQNPLRPNILFITISGLRYDAISPQKMPHLAKFAESSAQFMNHYSTGNSNNAGLLGLFYGLNGNYTDSVLNNHTPSVLLQTLDQEKYHQAFFSASSFKDSLFGQSLFYRQTKHLIAKQTNQAAVQAFIHWQQKQEKNQPHFAYISLNIRPNLSTETYNTDLAELDRLFAQILPQLDLDNSLIMISAEQGYTFQNQDENTQRNYFAREEIQVPMIIHWRDFPMGKYEKLSSHADLLPTLLPLYQVKNPASDYAQGENLFNPQRQSNWVMAANYRWYAIITPDGTQYHIDNKGNYQKYNRNYEQENSQRPPLGLFLEVFNQNQRFLHK